MNTNIPHLSNDLLSWVSSSLVGALNIDYAFLVILPQSSDIKSRGIMNVWIKPRAGS
jgi:hypothetical protein